ncbi:conserved hypothetical protein [metagenome]|uniref:BD-FAE-like domain-containing protein n=1 Tax=metagenome TaxID=256318 RepID=A0A2P2C7E9_9ZZZZ
MVVIHGGFWKPAYDLSLGRPLVPSLVAGGWAVWNLEYRRAGVAATLADVAAGIDALAEVEQLDLSIVVALGHSAGGHLAAWSAARARSGDATQVPVTAVISQAGVLDLRQAHADGLGGGAVEAFLGHPPGSGDADVDPIRQVPLAVPVWCVHARDDDTVPFSQSEAYVAAARSAGGSAELVAVEGDHFVVIDPASAAWSRTLELLAALTASP